jgi:putative tryptophan/tyrosine transport system substrate-binding protein
MKRRNFITFLGGAAAWPLVARAQQPAMPVIGFLHSGSPESFPTRVEGFRKGLREIGFVEGRGVAIEYRWAYNDNDRLPELAADLVRRKVAVIAAPGGGTNAAPAAKAATGTIPIVFSTGGDPVQLGLVASLNRPGGNITGFNDMNSVLGAKRLELLHELLPEATQFTALVNPNRRRIDSGYQAMITEFQSAATDIGRNVEILYASNNREIEAAFASLAQKRVEALVITTDPLFNDSRAQIIALAAQHRLPAIYPWREAIEAGGLMFYGTNGTDEYRQVGIYVGRVLKGEKPADLPVMRATKFELIINLKTATALGLTVPPSLLAIADEVTE